MASLLSLVVNGVTRLNNDTHGKNVYADKHITNGGSNLQFVKGDGSLDNTLYAKSSDLSNYLPLAGGWMDTGAQIYFKGLNQSTSVWGSIGYRAASGNGSNAMHTVTTYNKTGALYITTNGYDSANDYGGLAIDNDGVTAFGAGDSGSVFRVINEDSVADGAQFYVTKDSGAVVKKSLTASNFISNEATGTQPYACTSTTLNTNLNADLLDGIHASGLFTDLSNSGNNISVTIGGTNKTLEVGYANAALKDASANIIVKTYFPYSGGEITGKTVIIGQSVGASSITSALDALTIANIQTRSATAGHYYPGIAFNHMHNWDSAKSYNGSPQAWVGLRLHSTPGSELSYLTFATKSGSGASDRPVERMCIHPNGLVGIGTTSPKAKLSVYAYSPSEPTAGALGTSGTVEIGNAGNYGTYMWTMGSGDGYIQQGRTDGTATSYNLVLQKQGGLVGIGKVPGDSYKLDISGSLRTSSTALFSGKTTHDGGIATTFMNASGNVSIGGTLSVTGDSTFTGVTTHNGGIVLADTKAIKLRTHASYVSGIGYDTSGNECIALWAKNSVTRLRWNAGVDMSSMTSGTMMGITPDFEISKADGTAKGYIGGNLIWTKGNDGSGSGLDADLLDGNHVSALIFHKSYSSLSALPSESNGWYKICTIGDTSGSPAIICVRAYAHSSAIFTVSKGYSTSGNITLLQYCSSGNGSYAYIEGARLLSDGVIEVLIHKPAGNNSTYVNISASIFNADNIKLNDSLTLDTSSPTIIDSRIFRNASIMATTFVGNLIGTADVASVARSLASDGTHIMYAQNSDEVNFGGSYAGSTIYFGYRAAGSKPVPSAFVFGTSAGTATLKGGGFIKNGSSNDYVLLGGGGHKALSDFSMAHSHPYLPTAGGTMTGNITLGSYAILGYGSTIASKYVDAAAPAPEANAVWLASTGGGGEAAGIMADGNTVKLWSPMDTPPVLIDSDDGKAYTIIHSGNIGSQSVNYAASAGNADTVDSLHASAFMRASSDGSYYGLQDPAGSTANWIRTTTNGIIPATSGGASSLGTSSWPFSTIYGNNFYGTFNGGKLIATAGGSGSTSISYANSAITIGTVNRTGTASEYYPGIAFNHMYTYGGGTGYRNHAHAWIGLKLHSTPNAELSYLVFATNGNSTTGTSPVERMSIAPDGNISCTSYVTASGFKKTGSSDSYVLLGAGGHKALSDFSMAHSHPYLPLAGGTMSGTIVTPGNDSVVIKPAKNNYDQIGGEGIAFWKIFSTNFYGTLHGTATSATQLTTTNVGSGTQQIYFSGGVPVASTSYVGSSYSPTFMSNGKQTVAFRFRIFSVSCFSSSNYSCSSYMGDSAVPNVTAVTYVGEGKLRATCSAYYTRCAIWGIGNQRGSASSTAQDSIYITINFWGGTYWYITLSDDSTGNWGRGWIYVVDFYS